MIIRKSVSDDYGENTYLVYDETTKDAVLIDPGALVPDLERIIASEGLSVRRILLTHGHLDHMRKAKHYSLRYDAPIGAHIDEKVVLGNADINMTVLDGAPLEIAVDEYYRDGDAVEPFGWQVLHTPGHTIGSCCYAGKMMLFTGDTLFKDAVGRCDLPTGDHAAMTMTLARLLASPTDDRTVYPGHGQATTLLAERQSNPFSPYGNH